MEKKKQFNSSFIEPSSITKTIGNYPVRNLTVVEQDGDSYIKGEYYGFDTLSHQNEWIHIIWNPDGNISIGDKGLNLDISKCISPSSDISIDDKGQIGMF